LQETSGNVDVIFATIGTGGTITGITEYIKDRSPSTKIIGVEPSEFSNIPGIGASKFSNIFRKELLDDIVYVDSEDALDCCKNLARAEGILAGISSGAAFSAAKRYAEERHQEEVVVVFPDSGERYISTGLYS
jgi:cysteine synthase A